jgi:hypothetical protein
MFKNCYILVIEKVGASRFYKILKARAFVFESIGEIVNNEKLGK